MKKVYFSQTLRSPFGKKTNISIFHFVEVELVRFDVESIIRWNWENTNMCQTNSFFVCFRMTWIALIERCCVQIQIPRASESFFCKRASCTFERRTFFTNCVLCICKRSDSQPFRNHLKAKQQHKVPNPSKSSCLT